MKIKILYRLKKGAFGGGNQFLKALRSQLQRQGTYTDDDDQADVFIFNSFPFGEEYLFRYMYHLKKRNKIIVHRVDGPVFAARQKDLAIDRIIYKFNELLADGTIFQSDWSKMENKKQGMPLNHYETTIINAPEAAIFHNRGRMPRSAGSKIRLIATSWSSNPRKGFDVYQYLDEHLDMARYEMRFIGNASTSFKNIITVKPLPSEDLAHALRQSDIFISASMMEACSNSLIEAMHCGCVPIARNNTSHPEIVGQAGLLYEGSNDILRKIDEAAMQLPALRARINLPDQRAVAEQYSMFMQQIFQDVQAKKYQPKKMNLLQLQSIYTRILQWKLMSKFV